MITDEKRMQLKGSAELIILQHLGILKEMVDEFDVKLHVTFMASSKNKADILTRVKKVGLNQIE